MFNRVSSTIGGGNDDLDHTLVIGKQDPSGSRPNIMRAAARPFDDDFTGEGNTAYYWRFFLNGSKAQGNRHTLFTLNSANRNEFTAINIRRVVPQGETYPSNAIQMLYSGRILLNDTEATRGNADVLRKDEILPHVLGSLSFMNGNIPVTNNNFPIGKVRSWFNRDSVNQFTLRMSKLGSIGHVENPQPASATMENAPTGTYVVYVVRFSPSNPGSSDEVRDTNFFTVSHTQGQNETIFAYQDDGPRNCYFGWVLRVA